MAGYAKAKGELPLRMTYFVSFWWAIFWKEAIALSGVFLLWQIGLSFFSEDSIYLLIAKWVFAVLTLLGLFYFFVELFYAQLEKRYLRKNFSMICVDKEGKFVEPKIEHAKTLLWSFLWGHVSLGLLAASVSFIWLLLIVPWSEVLSLWWLVYLGLFDHWIAWIIWGVALGIYPHYWVWSRPFYNLSGFRFAVIDEARALKAS